MSAKNLIELENGAYKVKLKPCQFRIFVEDTQVEPLSQTSDNSVFDSETLVTAEYQETKTFKQPHFYTVITKKLQKDHPKIQIDVSCHSSMSFQKTFKKEMESFKTFMQAVERKFEELKKVILDLSTKDKQSNAGESDLVTELLKNRISALEKQLTDIKMVS